MQPTIALVITGNPSLTNYASWNKFMTYFTGYAIDAYVLVTKCNLQLHDHCRDNYKLRLFSVAPDNNMAQMHTCMKLVREYEYEHDMIYDLCIHLSADTTITMDANYQHVMPRRPDEVITIHAEPNPEWERKLLMCNPKLYYGPSMAINHVNSISFKHMQSYHTMTCWSEPMSTEAHYLYYMIKRMGYHNVYNKGITLG